MKIKAGAESFLINEKFLAALYRLQLKKIEGVGPQAGNFITVQWTEGRPPRGGTLISCLVDRFYEFCGSLP